MKKRDPVSVMAICDLERVTPEAFRTICVAIPHMIFERVKSLSIRGGCRMEFLAEDVAVFSQEKDPRFTVNTRNLDIVAWGPQAWTFPGATIAQAIADGIQPLLPPGVAASVSVYGDGAGGVIFST